MFDTIMDVKQVDKKFSTYLYITNVWTMKVKIVSKHLKIIMIISPN